MLRSHRKNGLSIEFLEKRELLTLGSPVWIEQGPSPTILQENILDHHVSGAVNAIAAHPSNADILFSGTVNGGVWKTNNATSPSPTWSPTTDGMPSLAIADLAFSPLDCFAGDPSRQTCQTLYAATGSFSSFSDEGGLPVGVYRTEDGGANWTQRGEETFGLATHPNLSSRFAGSQFARRIRDVVPTNLTEAGGQVILVGTDSWVRDDGLAIANLRDADNQVSDQLGVWRSADSGQTWSQVTNGLPGLAITDLIADPSDDNRFYATVPRQGVFVSNDGGLSWASTANDQIANAGSAIRILLSVHNSPGNNVLYAGVITPSGGSEAVGLETVYRSTNQGQSWTVMTPPRDEVGELHRAQGQKHGSILADANNPNVVYVGGASQIKSPNNGCGWPGRHFRGDVSTGQWTPLECTPADDSNAHADSREMVFDANGDLLEGNDGSIYRLTNRDNATEREWTSIGGNINSFELSSIAYDSLNNVFISGSQDNGSPQQNHAGSRVWTDVSGGDGQIVQVDNRSQPGTSIRYSSAQNLGGFKRVTYDSNNRIEREEFVRLSVTGRGPLTTTDVLPFEVPYVLNTVAPARMLLATDGSVGQNGTGNVYESVDRGDTLNLVAQNVGGVNSLVYGGKRNGNEAVDVAYIGTESGLWIRTGSDTEFARLTTFSGGAVRDIAIDPDDWMVAYVLGIDGRVWRSGNAGTTAFVEVTSNLATPTNQGGLGVTILQTIEVFGNSDENSDEAIFVGGLGGVYGTDNPFEGTEATWVEFGTGLPNAKVMDLRFDSTDNLLVAATLGRGAWAIPNVSDDIGSQSPVVDLNGQLAGRDIDVVFSQGGNPTALATDSIVADPDSATLESATITITNLRDGESERLDAETSGTNISKRYTATDTTGVLTLSGTDSVENYERVINSVTFDIAETNPSPIPREITFVLNDGSNNGVPAISRVRIQSVNQAPHLDLNGAVAGNGFTSEFRQDAGPVPIVDADRLSIAASSITLSSATIAIDRLRNGAAEVLDAITDGTGISKSYRNGVLTLSGSSSVESYQQVLRSLTYSNNSSGLDTTSRILSFMLSDGVTKSTRVTSTVILTTANSAPVLDLNGVLPGANATATLPFEAGGVFVAPILSLSDPNSNNLISATVALTNRPDGLDEELRLDVSGTAITSSGYDSETGLITLSGADSIANYELVLRSLEYRQFLQSPTPTERRITVLTNDGASNSAVAAATVIVLPSPNAPTADLNGNLEGNDFNASFEQGGADVLVAPQGTINNVDSNNLVSARIFIENLIDVDEELLTADTSGTNISASFDPGSGALTLTGQDTVAGYQRVLRTIRYRNEALRPAPETRAITVSFNDGTHTSVDVRTFIRVHPLRAIPTLDANGPNEPGLDRIIDYIEDSGPVLVAPNLILSHSGSATLESATAKIFDCESDELCQTVERLTVDVSGSNINVFYDAEFGELTLTGTDSVANYQRALRSVTYENDSQAFEFLQVDVDFFVDDGEDFSVLAFTTFDLKNVNDAPILNTEYGFSLPVSLEECGQTAEQSLGIVEDDVDSCFQEKGDLTDDIVLSKFYLGNEAAVDAFFDPDFPNFDPDDALHYPSIAVVGVDNSNGSWQFSTDSAETWREFENLSESSAVILSSDISNRVRFVPDADFNGTTSNALSFRAWDQTTANPKILEELKRSGRRADTTMNGGTSAFSRSIGELSITVFPVNDAPSFSAGPDQSVNKNDGPQTVNGWASDISAGAANESGQTLNFLVGNNNSALFSVQPSVSAAGSLSYTPATDAQGTAEVTVRLTDDGGTDRGGVDTSPIHTMRIKVGDRLLGDANLDGEVGFADFLILSSNFGRQVDVAFTDGDFDEDGEVGFADFLLLSSNFGVK